MSYRDPLEAALARIQSLERELEEGNQLRQRLEEEMIARQNAEAEARIAAMDAEREEMYRKQEREIAEVSKKADLDVARAQARGEAEAERARLEAELAVARAEAHKWQATAEVLQDEVEVLRQMSPIVAIEFYELHRRALHFVVGSQDRTISRLRSTPAGESSADRMVRLSALKVAEEGQATLKDEIRTLDARIEALERLRARSNASP